MHVDLDTIYLLIVQSIRMNKPNGDKCTERTKNSFLQEGIHVGKQEGAAHQEQEETLEHAIVTETVWEEGLSTRCEWPVMSDPPDRLGRMKRELGIFSYILSLMGSKRFPHTGSWNSNIFLGRKHKLR